MQSLACVLLILIYSGNNIEFETIHHILHGDHHVSHTEADESDPCHIAQYHHGDEGCHHDAHVSVSKKCPLCQHHVVTEKIASELPYHSEVISKTEIISVEVNVIAISSSLYIPSRAPPLAA